MNDLVFSLALDGGPLVLALLMAAACFGVPLPSTLILLATGALLANSGPTLLIAGASAIAGAVVGDQAGFWLGRLAGPAGAARLEPALGPARAFARRHGILSVFLTRWLVTPLGPSVNIVAGLGGMSWMAFSAADLIGETLWVGLYVGAGVLFADRIAAIADLLGTFGWFMAALVVTGVIGAVLVRGALRHRS